MGTGASEVRTVPVGADGLEGWSSCCEAAVTYSGAVLCCKECWEEVEMVDLPAEQGEALSEVVRAVIAQEITAAEGVARQRRLLAEKEVV